jgi:hypothetical protein
MAVLGMIEMVAGLLLGGQPTIWSYLLTGPAS